MSDDYDEKSVFSKEDFVEVLERVREVADDENFLTAVENAINVLKQEDD